MEQQVKEVALVTGGSRGIGSHICYQLAQKGFSVIFTYLKSKESADNVLRRLYEIHGEGTHAACQCDMADSQLVGNLFKKIRQEYGYVTVLVNNAGITGNSRLFALTSSKDWEHVFRNNLDSVLHTCRNAIPYMMRLKKGVIINITSISAHKGTAGSSPYAASKAAVIALTKTLFREVGICGIRTFAVSPGMIDTDMIKDAAYLMEKRRDSSPLKRIGTPEEVGNVVCYLATEAPAYLGGQEIVIDGLQV